MNVETKTYPDGTVATGTAPLPADSPKATVIPIGCITRLDIPVDTVLDAAKDTLESVVIAGYTKDGSEYFASTIADGGDVLWLLERCKQALFSSVDDTDT